MPLLRNLLFYPLFYGVSALLVVASVLAVPMGQVALKGVVARWGDWHHWCVQNILGIKIVQEGLIPRIMNGQESERCQDSAVVSALNGLLNQQSMKTG